MSLGKKGEEIAEKFLLKKGYIILERNFFCKFGEIDIIARKNDVMCFIEVKTRTNQCYGRPVEAITPKKIKHIIQSTQFYIAKQHLEGFEVRLDVIEIEMFDNKSAINHIENAIFL